MRQNLLLLAFLFFAFVVNAQNSNYRQDCNFLNDLHFKNGIDTITVLGYKTQLVRIGPLLPSLAKLYKRKKIKRSDVRYGVAFKPLNCSEETVADCIDPYPFAFKIGKEDEQRVVKIRCIVFEGYFEFSKPYFIIDKITAYD